MAASLIAFDLRALTHITRFSIGGIPMKVMMRLSAATVLAAIFFVSTVSNAVA